MTDEAKKVISNKRRSRTSNVNYMNKLFTTDIDSIQSAYADDPGNLVKLLGYKDIVERKLEKVNELSLEITESIEDEDAYHDEMAKFLDTEVKLTQSINQLSHFIKTKQEESSVRHVYSSPRTTEGNLQLHNNTRLHVGSFNVCISNMVHRAGCGQGRIFPFT